MKIIATLGDVPIALRDLQDEVDRSLHRADTYPALRVAVRSLRDNLSMLIAEAESLDG